MASDTCNENVKTSKPRSTYVRAFVCLGTCIHY